MVCRGTACPNPCIRPNCDNKIKREQRMCMKCPGLFQCGTVWCGEATLADPQTPEARSKDSAAASAAIAIPFAVAPRTVPQNDQQDSHNSSQSLR